VKNKKFNQEIGLYVTQFLPNMPYLIILYFYFILFFYRIVRLTYKVNS